MTMSKGSWLLALTLVASPALAWEHHDFDDDEVAGVDSASNKAEVFIANAVKGSLKTREALFFAHKMIVDHSTAEEQSAVVLDYLHITPERSRLSHEVWQSAKQAAAELPDADNVDCAYLAFEIQDHAEDLDRIQNVLIPATRHKLLRLELIKGAGLVTEHLEIAQLLYDRLGCTN
jgi:predicted outer membrane protein